MLDLATPAVVGMEARTTLGVVRPSLALRENLDGEFCWGTLDSLLKVGIR